MITRVKWVVHKGKQLGRTLWYPTANVFREGKADDGVYKMNILVDWSIYPWMWTYFKEKWLLEAHLFDIDLQLYWKEIEIFLLERIRNNQSFSWLEELVSQIKKDEEIIRSIRRKVMTFWTFDHLHPWHISYFDQAMNYGDELITIVARDSTVLKVKWSLPDQYEKKRESAVKNLFRKNHLVELGDEHDMYRCLFEYTPDVVYLWYDQHSFDSWIVNYCEKIWIETPVIIRGEAFYPEKYKSSLMKEMEWR